MPDPLDKFRRQVRPPESEPEPVILPPADDSDDEAGFYEWANSRHYEAMWGATRPVRQLHVCPTGDVWDTFAYRSLMHMPEDGGKGTFFVIILPFLAVSVYGRNLQRVMASIRNEHCRAIRMFNPKLHDQPEPAAPFIEKITFGMDKKIEAALELAMAEVKK